MAHLIETIAYTGQTSAICYPRSNLSTSGSRPPGIDWTVEQSEVKFNVKLPRSTQFDAAAVKASLGVGCPIGMSSKPRLRRWWHAPAPRGSIAFLQ
ncbi:hypothetical protein D3C76_933900 [compost metagenome]